MGGETKKPIAKTSTVASNAKPKTRSDNSDFKATVDDVYGVAKSAVDSKIDQAKAELVKRGAPILRDAIKFAAPVETAMVKNAGTVLNAVGKTAGFVSKAIPIVGGGIPSAIQAVSGAQPSFGEMQKTKPDMITPEVAARYRDRRPKLMMTKNTVTVKTPSYSGQSAFGKALMNSAKRKG